MFGRLNVRNDGSGSENGWSNGLGERLSNASRMHSLLPR